MKASMFKYKTQLYEINHLIETAHIQKAMEDGTYKPEPGLKFGIKERGHARYITSAATADKAVNHITCDEYLTPLLQKIFTVRQFILAGRKRRCLSSAPL